MLDSQRVSSFYSPSYHYFPKQVCPQWGVLTVGVKGRGPLGLDQGTLSGPRLLYYCEFLNKSVLVRCPCAFRLPRLAQNGCRGLPRAHFSWQAQYFVDLDASGWNPQPSRHFVRVRSLSLWRGANFDMARATVTLRVSDRSHCGAVGAASSRGQEIFWVPWKVLLWRFCKRFTVQS